jgi:hypothetical protein
MKYLKLTPFLLLLGLASAIYANHDVTPTIIARSQGRNGALKVAGLAEKVHLYDEGSYYNVDAAFVYTRSFRTDRLANCLFGDDLVNCNSIIIQGSGIANRDPHAWLADYFYLPPDYNASFSIEPRIQNILVNLDFFVGLDEWIRGLYFRVHGPLTWSRWSLNFDEPCDIVTTGSYSAGYFTWDGMTNAQLLQTFGDYAAGGAPANTSGTNDQPTLGVAFQGLQFAKIERCARSRTGFADVRFELGCDFLQSDNYHLGLNVQVVAPSGSRRSAEFAFDPTIGNGNHWEVGAGVSAHYVFWHSEGEDRFGGIYFDASLTHINNAREQRTFDLCQRPNSRYMLAEKLGRPVQFLRAGETVASAGNTVVPVAQFKGVFAPVANLTTLDVNVRASIQADIALMFNYTSSNWGIDVGYNFWARSCEKISLREQCCPNLCSDDINTWALKGDARVFGFLSGEGSGDLSAGEPIALSATECGATIHQGTNVSADVADCTGVDALQNCGIDNAQFGFGRGTGGADNLLVHTPGLSADSDAIKTSLEPKFINCCDINLQRTKGISNTVFANLNYTWDKDSWKPYFGIGGSVEFGSSSSNANDACEITPDCSVACTPNTCCDNPCSCCLKCSVSQWAVWLKGGLHF